MQRLMRRLCCHSQFRPLFEQVPLANNRCWFRSTRRMPWSATVWVRSPALSRRKFDFIILPVTTRLLLWEFQFMYPILVLYCRVIFGLWVLWARCIWSVVKIDCVDIGPGTCQFLCFDVKSLGESQDHLVITTEIGNVLADSLLVFPGIQWFTVHVHSKRVTFTYVINCSLHLSWE